MFKQKKSFIFLALFCTGLLLMLAPQVFASINTGNPSYDSMMQTELDKLLDKAQESGKFEAIGTYLDRAEFFSVLSQGLAQEGPIKDAYDRALGTQSLADANKGNPELQTKAKIAMDDLFLVVLYQIQLNKEIATTDQEITQALIDILEGRAEAFSREPQPFVLGALNTRETAPVIPPDPDEEIDDTQSTGFLFYGKSYDLETDVDVSKSINGVLWFVEGPFEFRPVEPVEGGSEESYSPKIMPLTILPYNYQEEYRSPYHVPILASPTVIKNDSFYRYTWTEKHPEYLDRHELGAANAPIPPVSASLYKNNWIAFVYSDFKSSDISFLQEFETVSVGLDSGGGHKPFHPGSHPGEEVGRENKTPNLTDQTGDSFDADNPEDRYLALYEDFHLEDEDFDLSELFIVFVPDSSPGFDHPELPFGYPQPDEGIGNQYKIHTGNPFMIVDRSHHHYDEGLSSLDEAIIHIADHPDTLDRDFRPGARPYQYGPALGGEVEAYIGDWAGLNRWLDIAFLENGPPIIDWHGGYEYGLQTLSGRKSYGMQTVLTTNVETQKKIDQSNFLAYVVQVEEDRVNEKILEMSNRSDGKEIINGIRDYQNIRNRDAFFVQKADAQAGTVTKDIHGNWVRVQQYILRSEDKKTMSVLNVSLREAGSVNAASQDLSGMSTINFSTTFFSALPDGESMRTLPWQDYLTTQIGEYDSKYISYYSSDAREVASMSVKFTNPGNESVTESRTFNELVHYQENPNPAHDARQYLTSEVLTLQSGASELGPYTNEFTFHPHPSNPQPRYGYYTSDYEYISKFDGGSAPGYYESNVLHPEVFNSDDKILGVDLYVIQDLDGTHAVISANDIWEVLGRGTVGDPSVEQDDNIEIIMSNSKAPGFFTNPIDTIFIPMSHMVWAEEYGLYYY